MIGAGVASEPPVPCGSSLTVAVRRMAWKFQFGDGVEIAARPSFFHEREPWMTCGYMPVSVDVRSRVRYP